MSTILANFAGAYNLVCLCRHCSRFATQYVYSTIYYEVESCCFLCIVVLPFSLLEDFGLTEKAFCLCFLFPLRTAISNDVVHFAWVISADSLYLLLFAPLGSCSEQIFGEDRVIL